MDSKINNTVKYNLQQKINRFSYTYYNYCLTTRIYTTIQYLRNDGFNFIILRIWFH